MKKIIITLAYSVLFITNAINVYAANIRIVGPSQAPISGEPFSVLVTLDTEGKKVSGVGGYFSFDKDLVEVVSVVTSGSVVNPWVIMPKVSNDFYFDKRTHIQFEGIFAGGFEGVKSAYHQGEKEGLLFEVVLIPKKEGVVHFIVDEIVLHAFDEKASLIFVSPNLHKMQVAPTTLFPVSKKSTQPVLIPHKSSLVTLFSRSDLVNRGALYLVIEDREPQAAITSLFVAEVDSDLPAYVSHKSWREVTSPYVISYQDRSKYIHIKVIYDDGTYTIKTIPPVENYHNILQPSHILVIIWLVVAMISLYVYIYKRKS